MDDIVLFSDAKREGEGRPTVSVIIPTYNRGWSLYKCLQSVFAQRYRPIECLVIDDGSTDNTLEVLEALNAICPEGIVLRAFRQENSGASAARNRGLLECNGEYVCFLDSDDFLTEDSVEIRVSLLESNPSADFCYGRVSVRNREGKELGTMNEPWPPQGEARIARYLFNTNSPMIRRSLFLKVGFWRSDDRQGREYEYFARLKRFARNVIFVDRVLSVYVKHSEGSVFDRSIDFYRASFSGFYAIKSLVFSCVPPAPEEKQELSTHFIKLASNLKQLRDFNNAELALREALLLHYRFRTVAHLILLWGAWVKDFLTRRNRRGNRSTSSEKAV